MDILTGARVFDGERFHEGADVIIEDQRVVDMVPSGSRTDGEAVDLSGGLLAPGFIDIQVNGGGGVLLNDRPDVEALQTLSAAHRQFGTTAMLPTLISDDFEVMEKAADAVRGARRLGMNGIAGVHFEGPYLNVARKGVHGADKIRPFEDKALSLYLGENLGVVVVTLAPECAPEGLVRRLSSRGVRVCAGHTAATYEETRKALDDGISGFTHLFNAMSPMESRAPGVVGAALEDADSWCGIIADGHHVHPATLKNAIRAKAPGKMVLVTDAMPTVGAKDKVFTIYGEEIVARNGRCATADGTLAGSDLDMASAVRNCVGLMGMELGEALRMASMYPAAFLGLDGMLGRIAKGYRADMVLLNGELEVDRTWLAGDMMVHQNVGED